VQTRRQTNKSREIKKIQYHKTKRRSADEKDGKNDKHGTWDEMNEHDAEPVDGVEVHLTTTDRYNQNLKICTNIQKIYPCFGCFI